MMNSHPQSGLLLMMSRGGCSNFFWIRSPDLYPASTGLYNVFSIIFLKEFFFMRFNEVFM